MHGNIQRSPNEAKLAFLAQLFFGMRIYGGTLTVENAYKKNTLWQCVIWAVPSMLLGILELSATCVNSIHPFSLKCKSQ